MIKLVNRKAIDGEWVIMMNLSPLSGSCRQIPKLIIQLCHLKRVSVEQQPLVRRRGRGKSSP